MSKKYLVLIALVAFGLGFQAGADEPSAPQVPNITGVYYGQVPRVGAPSYPIYIKHSDANNFCQRQGGSLPTAREFALYAQSLGARGIRETEHPEVEANQPQVQAEIERMRRDGYQAIYNGNRANQSTVDFYYNNTGYQAPTEKDSVAWTASKRGVRMPYLFLSSSGTLFPESSYDYFTFREREHSVRCVRR